MGKPVPEREAAKAAGERFYWTGKPCRNGHVAKRYTSSGLCSICAVKNVIASQKRRPEHPNRIAAREAGLLHYLVGKSCKHGHEDKHYVSNGQCVECADAVTKRYRAAHPGLEAEWARERRAIDPTGHRREAKKWAKANPEKIKVIRQRMIDRDPEGFRRKALAYVHKRRLKEIENGGSFTDEDIDRLYEKQHGCCAGCLQPKLKLEIDHVVAVANGGTNDPSNLQLLCRTCNASKGKKDHSIWLQQQHGRFL